MLYNRLDLLKASSRIWEILQTQPKNFKVKTQSLKLSLLTSYFDDLLLKTEQEDEVIIIE